MAGERDTSHDEQAEPERSARRHRMSWRTPVSALLIVIGCVLAPVSVIAVWTANQVSDTNRYVANIGPLIHERAVQNALTDKLTTAITDKLNVDGYTDQAAAALNDKGLSRVSSLLQSVAPSLASGVAGYIHNEVHKIVTGPRFARAWVQVNTKAHQGLNNVLSGRSKAVNVKNGQVVLDLAPFVAIVKQDLAAQGFTLVNRLPSDQRPEDRAADPDAGAAGRGGFCRTAPPPRPDRDRAGVRRGHAGAGPGPAAGPQHLPQQRPEQRAAAGRRVRDLRYLRPLHQDRAAHSAGAGPGGGDRRVLHRALGGRGAHPEGRHVRIRLGPPGRRAPGGIHRTGG